MFCPPSLKSLNQVSFSSNLTDSQTSCKPEERRIKTTDCMLHEAKGNCLATIVSLSSKGFGENHLDSFLKVSYIQEEQITMANYILKVFESWFFRGKILSGVGYPLIKVIHNTLNIKTIEI